MNTKMSKLTTRIGDLWDHFKTGKGIVRASFTIPEPGGVPFVKKQHYLQIILSEIYLAEARQWFIQYDPVALVAASYIYDDKIESAPVVIGPSVFKEYVKDEKDIKGLVIRNTPATSLHPWSGGALTLTVIFSIVQRANNVEKVLSVLEGFAKIASPVAPAIPFTSYIEVADTIMDGARVLLDLPEAQPLLAYRETINPIVRQDLVPGYLVLIDADQKEIEKVQRSFSVEKDHLLFDGKPYDEHSFLLLHLAQGDQRDDERILPFYPLWRQTAELAQQASTPHFWEETKSHFNTLKRALYFSPDLTIGDYERLRNGYLNEMKKLRTQAVEEANLEAGSRSQSSAEKEMQNISDELDQLDKL